MLAYSTIGVDDMAKATAFYDELLGELGAKQAMVGRDGDFVGYSNGEGALFGLAIPFDGNPCNAGNGNMVALAAGSVEQVHALYKKALSLGAKDAGEPGPRADGAFTSGYVYDMFGNKLNFFHM